MSDEPQQSAAEESHGMFEELGRKIDALPHVQSAERLVRQAQDELRRAQAHYQRVRAEARSQLHTLRDKNVGEVVGDALDYVRRHPGQGVLASIIAGFLLGRIFRR